MRRPALVLALALAGCKPATAPPPPPPTTGEPPPGGQEPGKGEKPTGDRRVAAMMKEVERLRGLPRKREVSGKTLSRDALIARVKKHVKDEIPHEVLEGQTSLLRALGLVPPTYDVEKGIFALLEAELAGYYEPDDKTMYLAADLGTQSDDSTLFHELVHAIQDQYWDLGPKLKHVDDGGDRTDAIHALAEGDATSAMMDFELRESKKSVLDLPDAAVVSAMTEAMMSSKDTKSVPPVLRRSLIASYTDGLVFVNRLRRRGGWAEVSKAWDRPPRTTEQLLHLDKYDKDEGPIAVPKVPAERIGPGFRELFTDLPGEQSLRLSFEDWTMPLVARSAAAGWGGDRITVFKNGTEAVVVWQLVFDGPEKGACPEAEEAWAVFPPVQSGSPTRREACEERGATGAFAARIQGCRVVVVAGPEGGKCKEALVRAEAVLKP